MDWQDEYRLALRATIGTRMPDVALAPQGQTRTAAQWFASLSPTEQAAMRTAVDQGARNGPYAGSWTERG